MKLPSYLYKKVCTVKSSEYIIILNRTMIIKRYLLSYDVVTCDVDQLYIENLRI